MAVKRRRAWWVEQARRLREREPEVWQEAVAESVDLADAVAGDAIVSDPWERSR